MFFVLETIVYNYISMYIQKSSHVQSSQEESDILVKFDDNFFPQITFGLTLKRYYIQLPCST